MKCATRGCPFPALPNDENCRNHTARPPEVPKVVPSEFEIVDLASVPAAKFHIRNERAFHVAEAMKKIQANQAIRVRGVDRKKQSTFAGSVKRYAAHLGVGQKISYRTQSDMIYFMTAKK